MTDVTAVPDLDDPATDPFEVARAAAAAIAEATGVARHDVALVLGSGWGGAADLLGETVAELASTDVPGFSAAAVVGHVGTIRSIRIEGEAGAAPRHALVLGSRTHLYEGRGVRRVVHGVRTAAAAGATTLVLTNGCGGLNPAWGPGTPVLIRDHMPSSSVDPTLDEGVYVQFPGPHYETPAEVAMAGRIGGDLVGMSTTLEAIAARHAGLEILGVSLVTNFGAGISEQPLSHAEVLEAGAAAGPRISAFLADVVRRV